MGYVRHDAIVLTGSADRLERIRDRAVQHFGGSEVCVTELTPAAVNDTASFLIAPDGSKEGWPESDEGDRLRQSFVGWLQTEAPLIDWIEVNFGGDESWEVRARTPTDADFRWLGPGEEGQHPAEPREGQR